MQGAEKHHPASREFADGVMAHICSNLKKLWMTARSATGASGWALTVGRIRNAVHARVYSCGVCCSMPSMDRRREVTAIQFKRLGCGNSRVEDLSIVLYLTLVKKDSHTSALGEKTQT